MYIQKVSVSVFAKLKFLFKYVSSFYLLISDFRKNKSLAIILISAFNIVINFILNFLFPAKASVEAYGEYRYIVTLMAFSGIYHLGYTDGYYLESISQKKSLSVNVFYLLVLVMFLFFISDSIIMRNAFRNSHIFLSLLFLFIFLNFIQLFNVFNYINGSFLKPVFVQLLNSCLFLIILLTPLSFLITHDIYSFMMILNFISLFLIVFISFKFISKELVLLNFLSLKSVSFKYHSRGIKSLLIGLIFLSLINLDKIILKKSLLPLEYSYYCFSNSFLVSCLGLSLSLSNKFTNQIFSFESDQLRGFYLKTIRNITLVSIFLMILSLLFSLIIREYFPYYTNLIEYISPSFGLFNSLLIIQLVQGNFVKRYGREFIFISYYAIVLILIGIIINYFNDNLKQMLLILSFLLSFAIFIFQIILFKTHTKDLRYTLQSLLLYLTPFFLNIVFYIFN
jgi:hypothetical protein